MRRSRAAGLQPGAGEAPRRAGCPTPAAVPAPPGGGNARVPTGAAPSPSWGCRPGRSGGLSSRCSRRGAPPAPPCPCGKPCGLPRPQPREMAGAVLRLCALAHLPSSSWQAGGERNGCGRRLAALPRGCAASSSGRLPVPWQETGDGAQ